VGSSTSDVTKPAISLTLSKSQHEYHSDYLFPFFYHMLPGGLKVGTLKALADSKSGKVIKTHSKEDFFAKLNS